MACANGVVSTVQMENRHEKKKKQCKWHDVYKWVWRHGLHRDETENKGASGIDSLLVAMFVFLSKGFFKNVYEIISWNSQVRK